MKLKDFKVIFLIIVVIFAFTGYKDNYPVSCPLDNVSKDDQWKLILVNNDNPLETNFLVDLELIEDYIKVDKRIVEPTLNLLNSANEDGISLIISSSYRSVLYQQEIFDKSISRYSSQGYNINEATMFTLEYYAKPLTSEHHTGLALDIVTPKFQVLDENYANTNAAKWLLKNASKYGFILRYPKDKEEITKIRYEPWHYRYVGKEHAQYIMDNNLCLEEYLLSFGKQ